MTELVRLYAREAGDRLVYISANAELTNAERAAVISVTDLCDRLAARDTKP